MLFFDFSSFFLSFMPIPMSGIANHYSNSNGTAPAPAAAQTGNCFSKKRALQKKNTLGDQQDRLKDEKTC
jgi:hypothetical protein